MSSSFITRIERDKHEPYTVIFSTDDNAKYKHIEEECRKMIDHAKLSVDAVPVVRCGECKWWRGPIYGNRCSYHSGPNHTEFYDADEFCSRGERKGGDE